MKNSKLNDFKLIFIAVMLFSAAVITLALPTIFSLKLKAVDNMIGQADRAEQLQQFDQQRALLEQANLIGVTDPRPLTKLAKYFLTIDRADLAYTTYNRLIKKDYGLLGNLALNAQQFSSAEKNFKKALSKSPQGEFLSGLAIAQFNLNKINEGCANSQKAINLNLNDDRAVAAKKICELLSTKTDFSKEEIYFLIQNKVLKIGEKSLDSLVDKTLSDYFVLAQINAARGDHKKAIDLAKKGLEIDKTNLELNKALLRYYQATDDKKGIEKQQKVLDNLILNDI